MNDFRYITNVEIADCMLRAGAPVTVKQLIELLAEHYPGLLVDVQYVRTRLAMFERSKNVICVVNKEMRPATYHMLQIHQEFFRGGRDGQARDFSHTVIPKKSRDPDVGISAMINDVWNAMTRKRLQLAALH